MLELKSWKINSLQLASLVVGPIVASLIGIGTYILAEVAGIDAWVGAIVSGVLGIIPLVMVIYMFGFKPEMNIIEKIYFIFGKYVGFVINFVIVGIMIISAATCLFSVANFLITQFLSETPLYIVCILLGIVSLIAVTKGMETISRVNLILVVITVLLYILLVFSLTPQMKLDNFYPVLKDGWGKPVLSGVVVMLTNMLPMGLLQIVPKYNLVDKKNLKRGLIAFYIIGVLFVVGVSVCVVGVLGEYLVRAYQYPEYIVLQKISLFGFIDRIENLLSVQWIFSAFSFMVMVIYYVSNFVKKKDKGKAIPTFVTVLIVAITLICFKSNTAFNDYVCNTYPYILSVLMVLFVVIVIGAMVKKRIMKKA